MAMDDVRNVRAFCAPEMSLIRPATPPWSCRLTMGRQAAKWLPTLSLLFWSALNRAIAFPLLSAVQHWDDRGSWSRV